jgi:lipid A 3-O-deacylase
MSPLRTLALVFAFTAGGVAAASAQTANGAVPAQTANGAVPAQTANGAVPARTAEGTVLTGSVGWFDFNDDQDSAMAGFEARFTPLFWKIRPIVGVFGNTDGGFYGYGGIALPLDLTDRLQLVPAFAVGGYHDGGSKDLGYPIEFRSALELNYLIGDGQRLGLTVAHLSNAHLDDDNPGTETLTVSYTIPLTW